MTKNYYRILGVGCDADPEGIKQAWRKGVKQHHPDTADSKTDSCTFQDVQEAYET